ncbi:disulfide bond formation protein DsbB [Vibrio sp. S4M6]|uniref:disulfide bond formation protein DsbB n=1 Tax=Vibrio sinus TaxID=2946865 RepID=UPI00202A51B6|nr:disulfide bond formation protein DsbB [Vibrio sinus]
MTLLSSIKQFSKRRSSWALLLFCALLIDGTALYFQHVMQLTPCVMCIYERVAVLGIALGALIGLINPKNSFFVWLGMIVWGISAAKGLSLSIEHVGMQLHPNIFATCSLIPEFPSWLPLHQWFPWMFSAGAQCSDIKWQFLTLSMPQWLIVIFAGNLVALVLVFVSQFTRKTGLTFR